MQIAFDASYTQALIAQRLCGGLRQASINAFVAGGAPYSEAGNTQSGCSAITFLPASGYIIYSSSFVTNDQGNQVMLQAFKAAQAGSNVFGTTARFLCFSLVQNTNTNTGVLRAQMLATNTPFLRPGGGCFAALPSA